MKSKKLVGIYWVLAELPIWVTAGVLFVITQLVILIGRDLLEGIPYQVAYSAIVGEGLCFTAMILIAATILQRGGIYIPQFLRCPSMDIILLLGSIFVGMVICILTLRERSGNLVDIYHDLVVMPLII